jgi:hypothetical protein
MRARAARARHTTQSFTAIFFLKKLADLVTILK